MILRTELFGSEAMIRERIRRYREVGITTLRLDPLADGTDERLNVLGQVMDWDREESPGREG
jgi:hypothetical protein